MQTTTTRVSCNNTCTQKVVTSTSSVVAVTTTTMTEEEKQAEIAEINASIDRLEIERWRMIDAEIKGYCKCLDEAATAANNGQRSIAEYYLHQCGIRYFGLRGIDYQCAY